MAKRAAEARRRRRLQAIAGSAVAVVAVVALAGFTATKVGGNDDKKKPAAKATPTAQPEGCSYEPTGGQGGPVPRKVKAPPVKNVAKTGTVQVVMKTSQGALTLTLNRAKAPCTANSFVSLVQQKYFDKTPCHRILTEGAFVLQCGDPGGTGRGGPGYAFADEGLPAEQATPVPYPAGTLAMANSGPGTNGSQFFIVYKDTMFPPKYTVFGKVTKGLDVVVKIAAAGAVGDKPKKPVTIQSAGIAS